MRQLLLNVCAVCPFRRDHCGMEVTRQGLWGAQLVVTEVSPAVCKEATLPWDFPAFLICSGKKQPYCSSRSKTKIRTRLLFSSWIRWLPVLVQQVLLPPRALPPPTGLACLLENLPDAGKQGRASSLLLLHPLPSDLLKLICQ